jgi:ribosomal protein S18 acetylase RimI-like enzyme
VLTLIPANYKAAAEKTTRVRSYQEKYFGKLEKLHKTLFPSAYLTARQMADKIDEHHRLFLAMEKSRLLGYHFCQVEPESESGYIDFIGTASAVRGRGIGADLLASGIDWMLSAPTTKKIHLTVNAENAAARTLYEKFGFVTDRIMRGYRKQVL